MSIVLRSFDKKKDIVSYSYWNDEEIEKKKLFNVKDLGFKSIENSFKYKSLLNK